MVAVSCPVHMRAPFEDRITSSSTLSCRCPHWLSGKENKTMGQSCRDTFRSKSRSVVSAGQMLCSFSPSKKTSTNSSISLPDRPRKGAGSYEWSSFPHMRKFLPYFLSSSCLPHSLARGPPGFHTFSLLSASPEVSLWLCYCTYLYEPL